MTKSKVAQVAQSKTTLSIKDSTLNKVFSTMKRNSSRSTKKVSITRDMIAKKLDISTRTVDRAVASMKRSSMIVFKDKNYYIV